MSDKPLNINDKDHLSMQELFTIIYCLIDDLYKLLFGGPQHLRSSNNSEPLFSDSEVITIALVGELFGCDAHKPWLNFVRKNFLPLFPHLLDRTRFAKRLARLQPAMEILRRQLLFLLNADLEPYRIIDSFPIVLCHLKRLSSSTCPFEYFATVGRCESKGETFYGMKGHLLITLSGIPTDIELTPAHVHDTKGLLYLMDDIKWHNPMLLSQLLALIGDKGYVGKKLSQQVAADYRVKLLAIQRRYDKELPESAFNQLLKRTRKIIETTISLFTEHFHANRTRARSPKGLVTRLLTKLTAFNLANYLNKLWGEPLLSIKSFVF